MAARGAVRRGLMTPLLEVEQLTKRFGGVVALDRVSLSVHHGETVGLIGPNGAGKTTLFNCITGLFKPTEGAVQFGREEHTSLVGLSPDEIAQCGIARTFQNIRLFNRMSALDNVVTGTYLRTHAGLLSAALLTAGARREERWANARRRSSGSRPTKSCNAGLPGPSRTPGSSPA